MTLSADPGRQVTIPLTTTNQGGASGDDYSLSVSEVVFESGVTEQSFTFTATDDTVDDDGESVILGFGMLPAGVTAGTPSTATVSITDNDDPAVTVSFGAATYSVNEGGTAEVKVMLSADPERQVTILLSTTNQGGASDADYSGVPASVVFESGVTEQSFTFTAAADTVDDDDESVKLTFGTLPDRVTAGTPNSATVSITDDDVTAVTVSFGAATYSADEGGTVEVKVMLSAAPGRQVTIPITATVAGGASDDDYSGVPASVVFESGDTEQSFTFTAADDTVDDDDESVTLGFGALPAGVSAGTTNTTSVSITDNDDPAVTVSFGAAIYGAYEGGTAEVKVTLSAAPGRQVTIPLTTTNRGGASDADYSGVPDSVVFESGETEQSFTVTATADTEDDDGESVTLGFGTLPDGVTAGSQATARVNLDYVVPADWSLIPTGLGAGDEFRLIFVTSNRRDAQSSNIADYNGFVQGAAGGGHTDIRPYRSGFRVLGSTRTVDARDNTATTPTTDDRGVPIYWLNGPRAADDYADFYDGAWDNRDPGRNEHGNSVHFGTAFNSGNSIWTGTGSDGIEYSEAGYGSLGSLFPRMAQPGLAGYEISRVSVTRIAVRSFYGLSRVFRVAGERAADNADLSDLRVDGTSVAGFAADTTSYTAGVEHAVNQVTIAASTRDPSAGLAYSTADADPDTDGHQVNLVEGANVVTVTVTARDATTIKTYTLTVNRAELLYAQFGAATYSVNEGVTVEVTVTLSADPERQVTIPIMATVAGGASDADYSGVPDSVVFESGDTEQRFTFTATDDTENDDDESVKLTFGTLPAGGHGGHNGCQHRQHHRRRRSGGDDELRCGRVQRV